VTYICFVAFCSFGRHFLANDSGYSAADTCQRRPASVTRSDTIQQHLPAATLFSTPPRLAARLRTRQTKRPSAAAAAAADA